MATAQILGVPGRRMLWMPWRHKSEFPVKNPQQITISKKVGGTMLSGPFIEGVLDGQTDNDDFIGPFVGWGYSY